MYHVQREPALLAIPVLTTIIAIIAHALHWDAATSAIVLAVVVALGHLVTAVLARPWQPSVFTGAVVVVFTLVSHYWLHLDPSVIQTLAVLVTAIFGNFVRGHVTPVTG